MFHDKKCYTLHCTSAVTYNTFTMGKLTGYQKNITGKSLFSYNLWFRFVPNLYTYLFTAQCQYQVGKKITPMVTATSYYYSPNLVTLFSQESQRISLSVPATFLTAKWTTKRLHGSKHSGICYVTLVANGSTVLICYSCSKLLDLNRHIFSKDIQCVHW
jgi:hypothetical protein